MKLLTPAAANAKTAKNSVHSEYLSFILHLAPYNLSGRNVCPKASAGCAAACLNTAGRGAFSNVQQARIRKTKLLFEHRQQFLADLQQDLDAVLRKAKRLNVTAVVRLNGTSDLDWRLLTLNDGRHVFEAYPDIMFYDYTKVLRRLEYLSANPIANYHVTFSRSECNETEAVKALSLGFNVAVVFAGGLPETYLGYRVVDGDTHDLRFLDKGPCIIGLKAKGKARKDATGFVVTKAV